LKAVTNGFGHEFKLNAFDSAPEFHDCYQVTVTFPKELLYAAKYNSRNDIMTIKTADQSLAGEYEVNIFAFDYHETMAVAENNLKLILVADNSDSTTS